MPKHPITFRSCLGPVRRFRLAGIALAAMTAAAQPTIENPVYVDDSPAARQVFSELPGLIERGNEAEAVRAIQRLLETEPDRLVPDPDDPDLFRSVRSRAHAALLADPSLLARYRAVTEPVASAALGRGDADLVERTMLLTDAGFDAALRVAGAQFRRAAFDAAAITLRQLGVHPALVGDRAVAAAEALDRAGRYANDGPTRRLAAAWADRAGHTLAHANEPAVRPPPRATQRAYGPFDTAAPALTEGLLQRPLRTVPIDPLATEDPDSAVPNRPTPEVLPAVAGETLLINDGERVAAFDAASLERLWTAEADAGLSERAVTTRRRIRSAVQDGQTVTAGGGMALAVTGYAAGTRREGDPRLHAMDLDTGEAVWRAGPEDIDSQLIGASLFGPAVISGDTAVIGLFTFAPLRRVHVAHLAGLDLYTGEPRWVRLTGTAGVLPSQRSIDLAPAMLESAGVVYRVEPLGVIAAVEADSGRPVWTRRLARTGEQTPQRDAWEQTPPIETDEGIVAFSPDGSRLIRFDPSTGAMTGSRPLVELGWPDYMLRVGDRLVFVGATSLATLPVRDPFGREPQPAALTGGPLFGRGVVAGDRLLLPIERGLTLFDPARGTFRAVDLEHTGPAAVAAGQLLVVDGRAVHGYLDWDSAERVLTARIRANPADPQHAIALAELADRSGRPGRIPPAADDALAAIERIEDPARRTQATDRLYTTLLGTLDSERTIPNATRAEIIERLGGIARSPDQRVGYLMRHGDALERAGEHRAAAEAYQQILLDEALAAAEHAANWRRQRADRAATGALVELIADRGPGVYKAFDRAAGDRLDELRRRAELPTPDAGAGGPGAGTPADRAELAERFERLAQLYPLARTTPEAWLAAAQAFSDAGQTRRSRAALRAGFEAVGRLGSRKPDADTIATLAGELATRLSESDRFYEAAWVLRRAEAILGRPRLIVQGDSIDPAAFGRYILQRLASRDRAPRISPMPQRMSQMLPGWLPVRPASTAGPRSTAHVLLRSERLGVVALWSTTGETDGSIAPDLEPAEDGLRPIWSRPLGDSPLTDPQLIRLTPATALFYRGAHADATLERIETVSGRTLWTTQPFASHFDARPARLDTGVVETPLDGSARLRDQLVAVDDRHAAIIERSGRTLVIDLETGEPVWAERLGVPAVYEASLRDGVLALIGERPADRERGERPGAVPVVAAYDIGTRAALFGPADPGSYARWIRHLTAGPLILGMDAGVASIDLDRGEITWTIDDPAVRLSGDAWLMPDRAYVLGADDRRLWQIDLATGTLRAEPLEDLGRVSEAEQIRAAKLPGGHALFATTEGMVVFDGTGRLAGGDGYDGTYTFRLPALAEGLVVTVNARSGAIDTLPDRDERDALFGYAAFDASTGRLRAEATLALNEFPRDVLVIDDALLIGLSSGTAVYSAPAEDD